MSSSGNLQISASVIKESLLFVVVIKGCQVDKVEY